MKLFDCNDWCWWLRPSFSDVLVHCMHAIADNTIIKLNSFNRFPFWISIIILVFELTPLKKNGGENKKGLNQKLKKITEKENK